MRYPLAAPHTSPPATAPHASLRPPAGGASTGAATRGRVRWWVLVLTCPLIAVDNLWVVWMERVERGPYVTTISLFGNAIFLLAALHALNGLVRRRSARFALSQAELLLV